MAKSFYDNVVLFNTPTAYVRGDDTSGTNAPDLSGNGLDFTYSGTYTQNVSSVVPGDGGKGVTLDGVSGVLYRLAGAPLGGIVTPFSLEIWIKPTASISRAGIISQVFSSSVPWELGINVDGSESSDIINGGFYDGAWRKGRDSTAVAAGNSYHFVMVFDGIRLSFYRNGALTGQFIPGPGVVPITQGNQNVFIGKLHDGTNFFNGSVARFAFYDHALTAADVLRHYNAMTAPPSTGGFVVVPGSAVASAVASVTVIGKGTAWTNGSSPISASAGTLGAQTVDATNQTVTFNYTAPANAQFVTFTESVGGATASLPVTGTPSGVVVAVGDVVGTAGSFADNGNEAYRAFDRDITNHWDAPAARGNYAGLDLGSGVAAVLVEVQIAPRPSTNDGSDYERRVYDGSVSTSNTSATSGLTSVLSITSATLWFRRNALRALSIAGAVASRWMIYKDGTNGAKDYYGSVAEVLFVVIPIAGLRCRPMAPTFNPGGGRWGTNNAISVPITSRTTSVAAGIYYTTGTTASPPSDPSVIAGVAQAGTTLYTGPLSVVPTAAGTVIKAITYDPTCTTPTSDVTTSGPFRLAGIRPNEPWYDTEGRTIQAHGGAIVQDGANYYWVGQFQDLTNLSGGGADLPPVGLCLYRSRYPVGHPEALKNWVNLGLITDANGHAGIARCGIIKSTSGKWVTWAHCWDTLGTDDVAVVHEAASIEGPYVLVGDVTPMAGADPGIKDFSFFTDDDGVTAYVQYVNRAQDTIYCHQMTADRHGVVTGAYIAFTPSSGRESPVMFKRGGVYLLETGVGNYYDSASTFALKVCAGTGGTTPLNATWSSFPGTDIFVVDPVGTDYNGQPSQVLTLLDGTMMMLMDFWVYTHNSLSNFVWLRMTFTSSTTFVLTPVSDWVMPASDRNRSRSRLRGKSC